jgi:flagellar hook-associated protein 1 FlgK
MNEFWSSMDAVASNPQSMSARQAFAQAANTLADGFNQVAADLAGVATQSDLRLNQTVTEINGISQRIAQLNAEIKSSVERNEQPNDLLDERDRLMDDLSKLVNYSWTENALGEVTITFGTAAPNLLVDPSVSPGFNNLTRAQLDAAFGLGDLTAGRAFADESLWDPATGIIPNLLSQLDGLVNDFATDMNAAHAGGTDLNGVAGGPMFIGPFTAAGVSFNGALITNPGLIAASNSAVGSPEPGNGQNFANILDVLRPSGQLALGGQTYESFYSSIITAVGARTQTANRDMDNADVLVEMAIGRRDQVSGVSLDEEMSNMLRFQHAYNASARVMTTMDDALDTIINRMGRVGL